MVVWLPYLDEPLVWFDEIVGVSKGISELLQVRGAGEADSGAISFAIVTWTNEVQR